MIITCTVDLTPMMYELPYIIIGVLLFGILIIIVVFICWRLKGHHKTSKYASNKASWHVNSKDIVLFECNDPGLEDTSSLYLQVDLLTSVLKKHSHRNILNIITHFIMRMILYSIV